MGASGGLTGYAGGLRRKRMLLDLEQDAAGRSARLF
jgi:methylated-DNA-[protein]-cysteine S-methyltransferase